MYTLAQRRPNVIEHVTVQHVIIKDRKSEPTKAEIEDAYSAVWRDGELRLRAGSWNRSSFMLRVVPAILLAALPDELEKIDDDGPSGIRLKRP